MTSHQVRLLRRITQIIALVAFLYFFVLFVNSEAIDQSANPFLRLDPLLMLTTSLAVREDSSCCPVGRANFTGNYLVWEECGAGGYAPWERFWNGFPLANTNLSKFLRVFEELR